MGCSEAEKPLALPEVANNFHVAFALIAGLQDLFPFLIVHLNHAKGGEVVAPDQDSARLLVFGKPDFFPAIRVQLEWIELGALSV